MYVSLSNTLMLQIDMITNLIQTLSSATLALFTIVLAVATWKYYKQSKSQTTEISRQTEEMAKTRELVNEPQMKAAIKPYHGQNFCLAFINIGGGIAQDVHADYWIEGIDNSKREWGTQVHFPGDTYTIGFPIDDSEGGVTGPPEQIKSNLENQDDRLVVEWKYKNASGHEVNPTQEFSISNKTNEKIESDEFYLGKERDVRF